MKRDADVSLDDFAERLEQLAGRPFWRVWRGAGSHLFFDAGTPLVSVVERETTKFEVGGHPVERRRVHLRGSHGVSVEMADWTVTHQGADVAHCESPDETFAQLTRWLCGQFLVSVARRGPTAFDLRFDLGALLAVRRPEHSEDDEDLISVWDDEGWLILRADGEVRFEAAEDRA